MIQLQSRQMNTPLMSRSTQTGDDESYLLNEEIEKFIPGLRKYYKNILGRSFAEYKEKKYFTLLSNWNRFLQLKKGAGVQARFPLESLEFHKYITDFIPWLEKELGKQFKTEDKEWNHRWLSRWNKFLQAQAGQVQISCRAYIITVFGLVLYILDIVTDIYTTVYYACYGKLWQFGVTLFLIYLPVIVNTVWKWTKEIKGVQNDHHWHQYIVDIVSMGMESKAVTITSLMASSVCGFVAYTMFFRFTYSKRIKWTGPVNGFCYFGSLFFNLPDLDQCWRLCYLETKILLSPRNNVHLVLEWQGRRSNVTYLKYVEGLCEACPQAILQLYLLVPDLHGDKTLTDHLRIGSEIVSLCTAGAALVNWERYNRVRENIDLNTSELLVLYMWVMPVTVSRLLSAALLLTMHVYWGLVCVALHMLLSSVYRCITVEVPRTRKNVFSLFLDTMFYFISPFSIDNTVNFRRVQHIIHFLCNSSVTMVWALITPRKCLHQALYIAIICFNVAMYAVGLYSWILHEKHWPNRYLPNKVETTSHDLLD